MRTRTVLSALAVGLALVGVAAPAAVADEPTLQCTAEMPPECKTAVEPVACTMSMPPECRVE